MKEVICQGANGRFVVVSGTAGSGASKGNSCHKFMRSQRGA